MASLAPGERADLIVDFGEHAGEEIVLKNDTVRADPGMITRIIIPFGGLPGRYVWHSHILEYEDNEMMRPFDVLQVPADHK